MIIRCRDAGMLSEDAERGLWINFSRRGWRRHEPLDDSMDPEVPAVLGQAFELVIGEGHQTAKDVLLALALPASDIESLSGLACGFLGREIPPVSIKADQATLRQNRTAVPAEIVRLPHRPQT